jgi:hypothetical protein
MAAGNVDFPADGLIATTLQHYRKKLEDVIFGSKPFLHIVKNAGIETQHGRSIVQPLLYGELSSKGSYDDDDTFVPPVRDGLTAAEYGWRHYYASIFFTGPELAQNSGKEQVLSLVKARVMQAEMSVSSDLNVQFLGDGTGNGGKDFEGLATIVEDGNTYGGIDRSDALNTFWRSTVDATAEAVTLAPMRTLYNTASEGNDQPTNIITTQAGFEAYEALLTDQIRYSDTEMADAGFQNLMFKAAPLVFDRDVAAGTMYFLNMNHIKFVNLDGRWFDWSDWLQPVNQDAKYKNLFLSGNLTCTNASRQAVHTGFTDA